MTEITLEITDFCDRGCKFCSSNAQSDVTKARFMPVEIATEHLGDHHYDHIHISGGEPLAHPRFYEILQLCQAHTEDVIVHTNALTHIAFNLHVIDNIYVEGLVTVSPDVDQVHVLKRVDQGRELHRPEVHFSGNWTHHCNCNAPVIRPDGTTAPNPCHKEGPPSVPPPIHCDKCGKTLYPSEVELLHNRPFCSQCYLMSRVQYQIDHPFERDNP